MILTEGSSDEQRWSLFSLQNHKNVLVYYLSQACIYHKKSISQVVVILLLGYRRLPVWNKILWSVCVIFFIVSMIRFPKTVFEGASVGLNAWWNIVFPSLLPFFIASELLMSLGVVSFMGILLEPIMRPLFNVPGCGSFVMVAGYSSGCPIGSMITAKLRRNQMCTRVEAERLMSFTNNSSPLFMLVAVSVGMFKAPQLGILIAGAHYLANLTLGFALRFYRKNDSEIIPNNSPGGNVIARAFRELTQCHAKDNRPIGQILGDAINNSVAVLLKIGGFMILFAVIIRLLNRLGFIDFLASVFAQIFFPLHLDQEIFSAIASGMFEITLGIKLASETSSTLFQQLFATAIMLGWSGLSIHAQVASLIADTDIRLYPYIITRFAHASLAALYTYIFWYHQKHPVLEWVCAPVLAQADKLTTSPWAYILFNLKMFLIILLALITMGIIVNLMLNLIKGYAKG